MMLMTGGSGLLGTAIRALDSSILAPARSELDITDIESIERVAEASGADTFLHLAAATTPPAHEENPQLGILHNIIGTANIARVALRLHMRLVYTSTDYVYAGNGPHREDEPVCAPSNFVRSKLGGECAAGLVPNHLLLRLSFGPAPFPWEKVYRDQYNSKLYVDEIAPLVLALARTSETGIMNVGGPRTTLEAYARRTREDIETIERPGWVPADTSLDCTRMMRALKISDLNTIRRHGTTA